MTLYNEIDPFAADWLERLIEAGHISPGRVERRSIKELSGAELEGFNRVHLFAGIGGWDYALDLAGWGTRPVWTGSCPCQPFSAAGKRKGQSDDRHLWPDMFRLIRECRPDTIFGEQVASAIGHGWLDGVFADLEREGYTCGAVVLGAHSVGAPHIRQRLWWVADSGHAQRRRQDDERPAGESAAEREQEATQPGRRGAACGMANADGGDAGAEREQRGRQQRLQPADGGVGGLANAVCERRRGRDGERQDASDAVTPSVANWLNSQWHQCRDGKARRIPTEPALFPLAHGLPGRVGLLRGAGNAIVPAVASEFIKAFMEVHQ